jgi:HNH endonuclease
MSFMAQPKVKVIGQLRYSESQGLQFSLYEDGQRGTWAEGLREALEMNWPGIAKTSDRGAYYRALHADPSYRKAAHQLVELQQHEPQSYAIWWAFRGVVYAVEQGKGELAIQPEMARLLVKHHVLCHERDYQRIRREVEAFENLEKIEGPQREPIPEAVRLFVWQRDKGRCVKCGSQQRLEFDHIIPISSGGSNTERDIQLLCEPCNRSKGATI